MFCTDEEIDGEAFLELTENDLKDMNLKFLAIKKLLDIRKVVWYNLHTLYKYILIINYGKGLTQRCTRT